MRPPQRRPPQGGALQPLRRRQHPARPEHDDRHRRAEAAWESAAAGAVAGKFCSILSMFFCQNESLMFFFL